MFIENPATKLSISKRKPICGVGINDFPYLTIYRNREGDRMASPYYARWVAMINRCYSDRIHSKWQTYKDCTVCDEWLYFSRFRLWMMNQDWEGKELDKDLIEYGNKVYQPDRCMFIPKEINCLLNERKASGSKTRKGVYYVKSENRYVASCCVDSKKTHIGRFKTEKEAESAYIKFKSEHILRVAGRFSDDEKIYNSLVRISREYR